MHYSTSKSGFFHPDVHGDAMPADAVEISDDEYSALLSGQSRGCDIIAGPDGQPCLHDPLADPAAALANAQLAATLALKDWTDAALRRLTQGIPHAEQRGWARKADVARTMLAAPRDDVPAIIAAEAQATGENPKDLAKKIVAKADHAERVTAALTGFRRAAVAEIGRAKDAADATSQLTAFLASGEAVLTQLGLVAPTETPAPAAKTGA